MLEMLITKFVGKGCVRLSAECYARVAGEYSAEGGLDVITVWSWRDCTKERGTSTMHSVAMSAVYGLACVVL